jgi:hypothetical protein
MSSFPGADSASEKARKIEDAVFQKFENDVAKEWDEFQSGTRDKICVDILFKNMDESSNRFKEILNNFQCRISCGGGFGGGYRVVVSTDDSIRSRDANIGWSSAIDEFKRWTDPKNSAHAHRFQLKTMSKHARSKLQKMVKDHMKQFPGYKWEIDDDFKSEPWFIRVTAP